MKQKLIRIHNDPESTINKIDEYLDEGWTIQAISAGSYQQWTSFCYVLLAKEE